MKIRLLFIVISMSSKIIGFKDPDPVTPIVNYFFSSGLGCIRMYERVLWRKKIYILGLC